MPKVVSEISIRVTEADPGVVRGRKTPMRMLLLSGLGAMVLFGLKESEVLT